MSVSTIKEEPVTAWRQSSRHTSQSPDPSVTSSHARTASVDGASLDQDPTSPASQNELVGNVPILPRFTPISLRTSIDTSSTAMDLSTTPCSPPATGPSSGGPLSKVVKIPPRPKPGRKPMPPTEASDRRRTQNRVAQRNFRDKRQQKVSELSDELEVVRKRLQDLSVELRRANARVEEQRVVLVERHRVEKQDLLSEIDRLKRELSLNSQERHMFTAQPFASSKKFHGPELPALLSAKPQEMTALTPPEDNDNEIDMTGIWMASKRAHEAQAESNSWTSYEMDTDPITKSPCGFCTDSGNCMCNPPAAPVIPQPLTGPGTCDRCQSDPKMATWCRSLANKTLPSKSASPVESNDKMMSCGQFIEKIKAHPRMLSIAELIGPLHSFPARHGFNVDEQEAARALQDMSSTTPTSRP